MSYPVAEVFYSLQGEGHFVGYPMSFVRLAGCSVRDCHIRALCDTDYKARESLTAQQIVERCLHHGSNIVSITGGEPADHDLRPLVDALTEARFRVHIETSGAKSLTGIPVEWLTVSPKTPKYLQRVGHVLKVVVTPGMNWLSIRELDQGTSFFHRYLQPLTSEYGLPINLKQVVDMVTSHENIGAKWALSTQAHRHWGLR